MTITSHAEACSLNYRKNIKISTKPADFASISLLRGLHKSWYPDSQILIFKSDRLFLCLYNVPNGSKGNGGHSHNDQMSIELMLDGKDICKDPGTYLYTSSPDIRNKYRSVDSHNTLRSGREPNGFFGAATALFAKQNNSVGYFSSITPVAAEMALKYGETIQRRVVTISEASILVDDQSNEPFKNTLNPNDFFSNGYGKILKGSSEGSSFNIEYKDQNLLGG